MTEPTTYQIVLRGNASERLLRPLLDDFAVDHPEPGRTRLSGIVTDPSHLHGVLLHLTSVAAEVISVIPVGPGRERPRPADRTDPPTKQRNQT